MRGNGTTIVVATAVALVLAGCTAVDTADTTSEHEGPRTQSPTVTVTAADRFRVLDRTFAPGDQLPEDTTAPEDLESNSQRRLGEVGGTTYWVGSAADDAVCLIARNPAVESPDNYSVCGLLPADGSDVVASMTGDDGHRTALVADGFEDHGADAMRRLLPNVWVR